MSAPGDREARVLVIAPAWRELAVIAAKARGWAWEDTRTALLAAETAGWDFERALREVFRLILDPDGEPSDLRNSVRAERPQPPKGPAVNAAGKARVLAAIEAAHHDQPRPDAGTPNQEGTE